MKDFNYTFDSVIGILTRYYNMQEDACYSGVMTQHDYKMDVDSIMEKANLTDKQQSILKMHHIIGYTQEEIAQQLGISQQGVFNSLRGVKRRIEKVLKGWNND